MILVHGFESGRGLFGAVALCDVEQPVPKESEDNQKTYATALPHRSQRPIPNATSGPVPAASEADRMLPRRIGTP
jgi:hypothetical protein